MSSDTDADLIAALAIAECKMRLPKTQQDCCAIVARIEITMLGADRVRRDVMEVASGMALGLFGEAYAEADYGQKTEWIDMCERALRQALEDFGGHKA